MENQTADFGFSDILCAVQIMVSRHEMNVGGIYVCITNSWIVSKYIVTRNGIYDKQWTGIFLDMTDGCQG